jgi:hypothetical protein
MRKPMTKKESRSQQSEEGDTQGVVFSLHSRFDNRIKLLLNSDSNAVCAWINTLIAKSLGEMRSNLDEPIPLFILYTKVDLLLKEVETAIEEYLAENHSEYLIADVAFHPPSDIVVTVGVDDFYGDWLSQSVH